MTIALIRLVDSGKWQFHLSYFEGSHEKSLENEPSIVNVYDVSGVLIDRDPENNTVALGTYYKFTGVT